MQMLAVFGGREQLRITGPGGDETVCALGQLGDGERRGGLN